MKKTALGLVAALIAVFMVSAPVAVAAAGSAPAYQPDGRIRLLKMTSEFFDTYKYDKPYIGDNRYNATGYRQTAREALCCEMAGWVRFVFGMSIENDGTSSDRIRVQATGTALEGWTVNYFHGPTNITSAVVAGTYTTPSLAPGADYLIKVKVRRDGDNYDTDTMRRLISLTSLADATKSDAVKVVFTYTPCTC